MERTAQLSPRAIHLKDLPKKVGEQVILQDGTRYLISGAYGEAKLMQTALKVDQDDEVIAGGWFNFWHHHADQSIVIAHGGKTGFRTHRHVMDQLERVIFSKTGRKMIIPAEERQGMPPEELVEGQPPYYSMTFPGLVQDLKQLEVELPGEQRLVEEWVDRLQTVNRDLPAVTNHGKLTEIREGLQKIAEQMDRSVNPHKKQAGQMITSAVRSGRRADMLRVSSEAQLELLQRSAQIVNIVLYTMIRYSDLEKLQISWNDTVSHLRTSISETLDVYKPEYKEYEPGQKERAFNRNLFIVGMRVDDLEQLKGEPYFSKARRFIEVFSPWLDPIKRRAFRLEDESIKYFLIKQGLEIDIWYERNQKEHTGVNFGKYSVD